MVGKGERYRAAGEDDRFYGSRIWGVSDFRLRARNFAFRILVSGNCGVLLTWVAQYNNCYKLQAMN